MKNQVSIKTILIIVASAIGAISTFLPWASMSILGSVNGVELDGLGWDTFILFAASITLAAINFKKELIQPYKIGISVASGISVLIAIIQIASLDGLSAGIGLIFVIIFGIASAILPWLPIDKRAEKAETTENNQK